MCGIQKGEKVVFIEDDSIQPVVIDDRRIEWNGQTTSLSALAQQIKGFNHPRARHTLVHIQWSETN